MIKLESYSRELMCRIAALLPNNKHGDFTGDKTIKKYRKEDGFRFFK